MNIKQNNVSGSALPISHERSTPMQPDLSRAQLMHTLQNMMRTLMWQSQKHAMDALERLGLTVPQMIVLEAIKMLEGRCVMSDLVRSTYLSGATLTGIVDRLISAGLVARERDKVDRRLVYVFLTSGGQSK